MLGEERVAYLEIRVSFIVGIELIGPSDVFKATVSEDQVFSRRKVVVRPVLNGFNIEQLIDDIRLFTAFTDH